MTLNGVKLGRAGTFMKFLASVVSLIFLPKNKITFPASAFAGSCRAGGNLQKKLPMFHFPFNLSLLNVKISRAFN